MTTDALHHQPLMPHLLIDGLNRYNDEPCLFLGDKVASYRDVRETASQMVQALQSKGLGVGSRVAVISANRPEVLSNIAAMQLNGCIAHRCTRWARSTTTRTCCGRRDRHADLRRLRVRASGGRAQGARPGLKNLLGFGPNKIGEDYLALAATSSPSRWWRPTSAPTTSPRSTSPAAPPASPRA